MVSTKFSLKFGFHVIFSPQYITSSRTFSPFLEQRYISIPCQRGFSIHSRKREHMIGEKESNKPNTSFRRNTQNVPNFKLIKTWDSNSKVKEKSINILQPSAHSSSRSVEIKQSTEARGQRRLVRRLSSVDVVDQLNVAQHRACHRTVLPLS